MNKKMKVNNFVKEFNSAVDKTEYLKKMLDKDYIPLEEKQTICKMIVDNTYQNKSVVNGVETVKMNIDSVAAYMLYRLNLVNAYMNVTVDFSHCVDEYNELNKAGIFKLLLTEEPVLPVDDLVEFECVLEMTKSDFVANKYEIHNFVTEQIDRVSMLLGSFIKPVFNEINTSLKELDNQDISTIVSQLKSLIES